MAYSFCNIVALIISSAAFAPKVQWNRSDCIDVAEKISGFEDFGIFTGKELSKSRSSMIFCFVENLGMRALAVVVEKGSGAFNGYESVELATHLVVGRREVEISDR